MCGDIDAVVRRVAEHHDAGADHVCVQVLTPQGAELPIREWTDWRRRSASGGDVAYLVLSPAPTIAWAAARRAIGTRNGEQLT